MNQLSASSSSTLPPYSSTSQQTEHQSMASSSIIKVENQNLRVLSHEFRNSINPVSQILSLASGNNIDMISINR